MNAIVQSTLASDRELPKKLAFYLAKANLGVSSVCGSHRRLAPELALGRHRGPVPRKAYRAAVLICLTPDFTQYSDGSSRFEWKVPLTVRAKGLQDHGGQIALPGGRLELGENGWIAAVREYREELFGGNSASQKSKLVCLGQLSPIYVYASNNQVDVFVTFETIQPIYQPAIDEVAEVVSVPLSMLLSEEAFVVGTMGRGTTTFEAPGYRFGEHFVWGATAMILAEFEDIVRQTQ